MASFSPACTCEIDTLTCPELCSLGLQLLLVLRAVKGVSSVAFRLWLVVLLLLKGLITCLLLKTHAKAMQNSLFRRVAWVDR
jgi:hypothetical protein